MNAFDEITIELVLGLLGGLVAFTILFHYLDAAARIKKWFKLKARVSCFAFIFLFGVITAVLFWMICDMLALDNQINQIGTGILVGMTCSLIPGLLRSEVQSNAKASKAVQQQKAGRRSKG